MQKWNKVSVIIANISRQENRMINSDQACIMWIESIISWRPPVVLLSVAGQLIEPTKADRPENIAHAVDTS